MNSTSTSRRQFLIKSISAVAVIYIIPSISERTFAAKTPAQKVSNKTRWAMHIDTAKCADSCTACIDACNKENGLYGFNRPKTDPQWIRKVKIKDINTDKITILPMLCQHCENPPCCDVCPTGASFRREDGIVMVNQHTCIGCRYCMMACPFKARSFVHENLTEQLTNAPRGKGCVESCNFCVGRLDAGKEMTTCEEACIDEGHQAISFGNLANTSSRVNKSLKNSSSIKLRADLKLNQRVTYTGF